MLLLTFGLMVVFAVVAKKKYTEFETQHRLQAALVKSQMIEMERRQAHERLPDQGSPSKYENPDSKSKFIHQNNF